MDRKAYLWFKGMYIVNTAWKYIKNDYGIMNDLKKFEHGEEETHFACMEMVDKYGPKTQCCGCNNHNCKQPKDDFTEAIKNILRFCKSGETSVNTATEQIKAIVYERKKIDIGVGMLRQWLNEDRIKDADRFVTNEQIRSWFEIK